MLLKIEKGKTIREANAESNFPFDLLPKFFSLTDQEQVIVAFCADIDSNPVRDLDERSRAYTICNYFEYDYQFALDICGLCLEEGNKYYEAVIEYRQYQPNPIGALIWATNIQAMKLANEIAAANANIKAAKSEDPVFERILAYQKQSSEMIKSIQENQRTEGGELLAVLFKNMKQQKSRLG